MDQAKEQERLSRLAAEGVASEEVSQPPALHLTVITLPCPTMS